MKSATALFLVLILVVQPAVSFYDDALFWGGLTTAVATGYFVGPKIKQGVKVVLPAMLGSAVVWTVSAASMIGRKFDRGTVSVFVTYLVLGSLLIYKSMKTCPRTGHQGCTCGL